VKAARRRGHGGPCGASRTAPNLSLGAAHPTVVFGRQSCSRLDPFPPPHPSTRRKEGTRHPASVEAAHFRWRGAGWLGEKPLAGHRIRSRTVWPHGVAALRSRLKHPAAPATGESLAPRGPTGCMAATRATSISVTHLSVLRCARCALHCAPSPCVGWRRAFNSDETSANTPLLCVLCWTLVFLRATVWIPFACSVVRAVDAECGGVSRGRVGCLVAHRACVARGASRTAAVRAMCVPRTHVASTSHTLGVSHTLQHQQCPPVSRVAVGSSHCSFFILLVEACGYM